MNQETNPTDNSQDETRNPLKENKNRTWIYLGIIAALLGINIFLFVNRNKMSDDRDRAYMERDSITLDRDNIRSEYDAALARLDQLVTKNADMEALINDKDGEIAKLKLEIQDIIAKSNASKADLTKARDLINTLNGKVKSYEARIAELEIANQDLSDRNALVSEERDSAVTQNIALKNKVRLGSVLHASNIRLEPIDLRRNGRKEKTTSKARRTDIFRVTFDIDENRIAEDGSKELYIRIIDPNGNLLSNAAYGSGVSKTYDGKTLNYTIMKQINLKQDQKVRDIIADWHQESDYNKGNYTVEIFNGGYKIGDGTIALR